jgi:hypothetical protein
MGDEDLCRKIISCFEPAPIQFQKNIGYLQILSCGDEVL